MITERKRGREKIKRDKTKRRQERQTEKRNLHFDVPSKQGE